jgi:hypothetical protein
MDKNMSENIARNKFADANSFVFPYTPAKAVDGAVTVLDRWLGSSPIPVSGTPAPNWLRVDLGAYYWINRWAVSQMGGVGWPANYNLSDYKLQGSLDNANWFDMDSVANNSAGRTDRVIPPTKVRWVRVYITKGLQCNTNFASIMDLEIYAADPTSPYLSNLVLSNSLALDPAFSQTVNSYTSDAGYDIESITITPTAVDAKATIKVNGVPVASGQPSGPIGLNPGVKNPISVQVSPLIGEVYTYSVDVTRASSPYLANLVIDGVRRFIFDKNTFNYSLTISAADTAVTPTAEDAHAAITVNGQTVSSGQQSQRIPLQAGQNIIEIIVNSAIGKDLKKYTLTITKS